MESRKRGVGIDRTEKDKKKPVEEEDLNRQRVS